MTKIVLELPALAIKLHHPDEGYIKVFLQEFPNFFATVNPLRSVASLPVEQLKFQYKGFLMLEKFTTKLKHELKKAYSKILRRFLIQGMIFLKELRL